MLGTSAKKLSGKDLLSAPLQHRSGNFKGFIKNLQNLYYYHEKNYLQNVKKLLVSFIQTLTFLN